MSDDDEVSGWFSLDDLGSPCLRLLERRLLGSCERSRRERREGDLDLEPERLCLCDDLPVCANVVSDWQRPQGAGSYVRRYFDNVAAQLLATQ